MKKLKIVCVVVSEMGHLNPIVNCATALQEQGHELHIITNGNDRIKEKTATYKDQYSIEMHYTDCGLASEDLLKVPEGMEDPTEAYLKKWDPYVYDLVAKLKPDLVLSDFFSCCGTKAAMKLGIPAVINLPGPTKYLEDFGVFEVPNMNKASTCCGIVCFKRTCKIACLQWMFRKAVPYTMEFYDTLYE